MVFHLKEGKLQLLERNPFQKEREIQAFFEAHLTEITGYDLLQSEFTISAYRMDSVAYNPELNSFVIIEYKRGQNESLVDQGFAYLKTVLDRRADFVLLYNEKNGVSKGLRDFDWSQTRVLFVSPKFTKYQIDATNIDNNAFELYEITRYSDSIIHVNQIVHDRIPYVSAFSAKNIKSMPTRNKGIVSEVERKLKVYDLAYHYQKSKANQFVRDSYEEMRERILQFDPALVESFTKHYIVFKYNGRNNIVSFWLRHSTIEVVLAAKRGEITDLFGITYDISNRLWSSEQYALLLKPDSNFDDIMDLIRRTYNANKHTKKQ